MAEAAGFKWWKFLTWGKTGRDMDIVANDDGAEAEAAELDAQKRIGMGYHYRNTTEWIGFYEKGKVSARLSYNWRGKFLAETNRGAAHNPAFNDPYGQVDLSIN